MSLRTLSELHTLGAQKLTQKLDPGLDTPGYAQRFLYQAGHLDGMALDASIPGATYVGI